MTEISDIFQFFLFAIVMTGTPGPNNAMVAVAGARLGMRGAMPLVLGITCGVALMLITVALGLGQFLQIFPWIEVAMLILSTLLLLWIAWKIATAGPVRSDGNKAMLGFKGGMAYQWINPKAWAMTGSAVALYIPVPIKFIDVFIAGAIFWLTGTVLVSLWALFGSMFRKRLESEKFALFFNISMAGLLLVATLPVMISALNS